MDRDIVIKQDSPLYKLAHALETSIELDKLGGHEIASEETLTFISKLTDLAVGFIEIGLEVLEPLPHEEA